MFGSLPCNECGGKIYYDQRLTSEAWLRPEIFTLEDVYKLIDSTISEILVFTCIKCNTQVRYTFKEVEKQFRKKLSIRLLTLVAVGNLPNLTSVESIEKVMFYCGKCSGYEGKGSCPLIVYRDCNLKKIPKL